MCGEWRKSTEKSSIFNGHGYIALDGSNIFVLVVLILAIPMIMGMCIGHRFPRFVEITEKPFRIFAFTALVVFVVAALSQNIEQLKLFVGLVVFILIGQNTMAMLIGYLAAKAARLSVADQRALTFEVGIQNSVLGISIVMTFYSELFGMIQIVGMSGMWHLISGLLLASIWSRIAIPEWAMI